ncbi:formate dehydrogenase subunit gamma [Acidisoma sp. C75]
MDRASGVTAKMIEELLAGLPEAEGPLWPALHAVLDAFGHVPQSAVQPLAKRFNLSRAEVLGVITFYHDFRTAPPGRHVLKLCRAEACQSVGAAAMAEELLVRLGIGWGETAADASLTVEPAYCLGLCACGPAALLDGMPIGRLTPAALERLAQSCAGGDAA